jgi:hypothetical protein
MKPAFAAAAIASFAIAAASPASAMTYRYSAAGAETVIDAKGVIALDERAQFGAWFTKLPADVRARRVAAIVLDSPGGNVIGAESFATMIHDGGVNTSVAPGAMCASACALIWASGIHKSVDASGQVGVHNVSGYEPAICAGLTSALAKDLSGYGAPATVVTATVTTPSNQVYWLTPADFAAWDVNIVGDAL